MGVKRARGKWFLKIINHKLWSRDKRKGGWKWRQLSPGFPASSPFTDVFITTQTPETRFTAFPFYLHLSQSPLQPSSSSCLESFSLSPSWCLSTSYFGRQIYWTSPFCRHYYILSCAVKSFYILKNKLKESQMQTDTNFIEQHKGFFLI